MSIQQALSEQFHSVIASSAVGAGRSAFVGDHIDTDGFGAVCFIIVPFTIDANAAQVYTLEGSDDNVTWVDVPGVELVLDGAEDPELDNKPSIMDIEGFPYRYIRLDIDRTGGGTSSVMFAVALLYQARWTERYHADGDKRVYVY